jgi:phosphoribosyl-ATP pyrophosphohydrolase
MNEKIDFGKMNGLVPTIIQEENGKVLSLIYSSEESLEKSVKTKRVWSYSRSRNGVFQKGATSGNTQKILQIRTDCDNDAILFKVKQEGTNACHTGAYSCFGEEKEFDFPALYEKILSRKKAKGKSYTKKLFSDKLLLKRKLVEEAAEVITAKNKKELIWECADLLYFIFVVMASEGVSISDIEKENKRRDKN